MNRIYRINGGARASIGKFAPDDFIPFILSILSKGRVSDIGADRMSRIYRINGGARASIGRFAPDDFIPFILSILSRGRVFG